MPKQELLRVRADFNQVDEDNRLHVLPRQADRPDALVVGARVLLSDDEGSTMLGDVIERTERLAAIQVLPRTWRNPRAPADPAWARHRHQRCHLHRDPGGAVLVVRWLGAGDIPVAAAPR